MKTVTMTAACALALAASAHAGYTFTQQTAQTQTYGTGLNFDEAGGPTGPVASNAWTGYGLSGISTGGDSTSSFVDNFSAGLPWVDSGNACYGTYGVYVDFATAANGFSFQAWDASGPPTFFGGGLYVYVLDANFNIIDGLGFTPAWGGVGKTWYNVTGTAGSTFSHILITGNSFFPETFVDNLSWNTVPGPGGLAFLGLALMGRGRRRA